MNEGGGRVPLSAARGHYKGTCTLTLRETCVFARAFPQHKGNVQSEEGEKKKICKSWHGGVDGQPQPSDVREVPRMRSTT